MKNIYKNVDFLDREAIKNYNLNNELLMENAACVMEQVIDKYASANSMIIIVAGIGNNGADGLALARRLIGKYNIKIYMPNEPKSELCKIQKQRVELLGGKFIDKLFLCDIVVDCLFGSGFYGVLSDEIKEIISQMNSISRLRIACDIPSGILDVNMDSKYAFKAHITISMGSLKLAYFSDFAKDFIGDIIEANLGISKERYELETNIKLLETSDLKLPKRNFQNAHKGNFGHSCIIAGEKEGACILSAMAAFAFGSGLVSIIGNVKNLPYHIMNTNYLPKNCNAIGFGMGLGERINKYDFDFIGKIPSVLDADMFYHDGLKKMLENGNIILTPHLKEFASLLRILNFGSFEISDIIKNKLDLILDFSKNYPKIPLILKGANVFIAYNEYIYINNLGRNNLSKGGSGDVLSGLIVSLLSQGYSLIDASISASIAHTMASINLKNTYSLEPLDLINEIKKLEN
ncbi:NAD(P)H-hydrate dehydratase [Helicobacter sp. MIT 14-3879]|uniref:NAD(P)H-hydrate dehydratase n=1 Tax=Helicobacter sp. MIT 14-3879 TaxID=2040649 RepID=UPI000E1E57B9|nr:NAD(P)H-hydrate dehydratase [Helicobacter sp. MIT 14-3879]RDU60849.1 bifunctional ADP-dependent NAD(P)H-hydrate dehydratase/NAD(P)H-hydrate epimerase [Helicobacter sp. MIT 14-3879]